MNDPVNDLFDADAFVGFDSIDEQQLLDHVLYSSPKLCDEDLAVIDTIQDEQSGVNETSPPNLKKDETHALGDLHVRDAHGEKESAVVDTLDPAENLTKREVQPSEFAEQYGALEAQEKAESFLVQQAPLSLPTEKASGQVRAAEYCSREAPSPQVSSAADVHSTPRAPLALAGAQVRPAQSSNTMITPGLPLTSQPEGSIVPAAQLSLAPVPSAGNQAISSKEGRSIGNASAIQPRPPPASKRRHPGSDLHLPKKRTRTKIEDMDPAMVHVCTYTGCNKKFAKKYNLKIHERRHRGDLPFICDYQNCGKKFMWLSSFSRHQRVHEARPGGPSRRTSKSREGDRIEVDDELRPPDSPYDDGDISFADGHCTANINGMPVPVDVNSQLSVETALCLCALSNTPCDGVWELHVPDSLKRRQYVAKVRAEQVATVQAAPFPLDNPHVQKLCTLLTATQ